MPCSFRRGVVTLLAVLCFPAAALAQAEDCPAAIETANDHYQRGRFDDALALLEPCLEDASLTTEQRVQTYRLAAFNYLAKDLTDEARQAVEALLTLEADHELDILMDPPAFVRLVGDVRVAREAPPPSVVVRDQPEETAPPPAIDKQTDGGGKNLGRWALIGGGLVAGGVLAAVLLLGPGGEDPISGPPGLPSGN